MFFLAAISLFTGALSPDMLQDWQLEDGVTAVAENGGVLLRADVTAPASARAFLEAEVPSGWRGKAVCQEIETVNRSPLVWSGEIWIDQLDASGGVLPESLADHRWTTHMRPPGKKTSYRHPGHIHPKACRLRLNVELRRPATMFDGSGLPLSDPATACPSLFLSRLEVSPADPPADPNPAFFVSGASGEDGDCAFVCGGRSGNAFSFQTRTRGAWSNAVQFRDESDLAFPSGAGTLEAWFKPDWKTTAAGSRSVTLFEGYQGYTSLKRHKWRRTLLDLKYVPSSRMLTLHLSDWAGHAYDAEFSGVALPDGAWTHVALQWTPGGTAEVFVGGKSVGRMDIPGFEAVPIADSREPNPNDLWITEVFVGAPCRKVKDTEDAPLADAPFFSCAVDSLRASTGCRYGAPFVPAKRYGIDPATRAHFPFDRCYDGGQGGGFGFVPGTVYSTEDRMAAPPPQRPFSDEIPFDLRNYKRLPTPPEHAQARRRHRSVHVVRPDGRFTIKAGDVAYPDFVEIENVSGRPLAYPIVVADGGVDPRSYADIASSLGLAGKTDREKVDALFQYVLSSSDYFVNRQVRFQYGTDRGHCVCNDALVMLKAYCGFECGYLNNLAANLFSIAAGCPASQAAGYGHSFQQVFFGGREHLYDVARQRYFTLFDNVTPAGLADIEDQPGIIARTGIPPNNYLRKGTRVRGGHGANDPRYQEKCAQTLNPGERMRVCFGNDGRMNNLHFWPKRGRYTGFRLGPDEYDYTALVHADSADSTIYRRDRFFPEYANAFICFDSRPDAANPAFCRIGTDSFCYRVRGTCPVVWGEYAAERADGGRIPLSVSTDGGKTFRPLPRGADGSSSLEYLLRARDGYLVRVESPMCEVVRFRAVTERQINARTYPGWPRAGKTDFTFSAVSGDEARITLAWREPAKRMSIEGGVHSGAIPGYERQLAVFDPADGASFRVHGASKDAKVRTYGRVRAGIAAGELSLSYAPERRPLMPRGDDMAGGAEEFPAVAAVDVIDGDSVKSLTLIIQPGIRLVPASSAKPLARATCLPAGDDSAQPRIWCTRKGDGAGFPCSGMPSGEYAVFALARFACGANRESPGFELDDSLSEGKSHVIAAPVNPTADYLFAPFGPGSGRSRWKWDCGYRPDLQLPYNGWIIRTSGAPRNGVYSVRLNGDVKDGAELAALLVVPMPGLEGRADLRKILFGLNCDPSHVVPYCDKGDQT